MAIKKIMQGFLKFLTKNKFSQHFGNFKKVFLSTLINNLVAFAITLYATKSLEIEDFGVLALYISFIGIGSLLVNFGFSVSIIRFYKKYKNPDVFYTSILWNLVQVFLILFLSTPIYSNLVGSFPLLKGKFWEVFYVLFAISLLNVWQTLRASDQAEGDFKSYRNNTYLYAGIRTICFFIFLLLNPSKQINYIYFIHFLFTIPLSVLLLYNLGTRFRLKRFSFKFKIFFKLINYGKWIVASGVAFVLILRLPQMNLANAGQEGQLGLYGTSLTFLAIFSLINESVRSILLPEVIGFDSEEKLDKFKKKLISIFPIYLLICGFTVLGLSVFQYFFMSGVYQQAIVIFIVQSIGLALTMFIGYYNVLIHNIGKPHIDAITNLLRISILFIVLPLIPQTALSFSLGLVSILVLGEIFACVVVSYNLRKSVPYAGNKTKVDEVFI